MPIYAVGVHNPRVQIPHQPLTVSISGSVGAAALLVSADHDQPVMRPNSHLAVLPRLSGPVSIGVRPATGVGVFAQGTVVNLAIGHDSATDIDPVQVVFDPVDVAGDAEVELAVLAPLVGGIEVMAAALPDIPLSPLASAARTSTRKVVGRGARTTHGAVLLAIDASASMRPVFVDGSVAAVADIIVGVADAVGVSDVTAVLVGETATPVPSPGGPAGLAEAVSAIRPRWCAGARWSRLTETKARTIVCSDFPTTAVLPHYPVLAISSDPRLDSTCVRMPLPRPGTQAMAELLAQPGVVDALTYSLVQVLR
jgi:hypothetical protein